VIGVGVLCAHLNSMICINDMNNVKWAHTHIIIIIIIIINEVTHDLSTID
jgi:hypothetical protein